MGKWSIKPLVKSLTESYTSKMVAYKLTNRYIKPSTKIQAVSTQATLDRNPKDDVKYLKRLTGKAPKGWKADRYYQRPITPNEYNSYEAMRHSSKNTEGQSELKGYSEETYKAAIEAFKKHSPDERPFKQVFEEIMEKAGLKDMVKVTKND